MTEIPQGKGRGRLPSYNSSLTPTYTYSTSKIKEVPRKVTGHHTHVSGPIVLSSMGVTMHTRFYTFCKSLESSLMTPHG
jgi:hypothetical protein